MTPDDVTLVRNAIHNPAEPRHFMRVVPAERERSASVNGTTIARSSDALIVKEVGFDLYDHVVYFPRDAVIAGALVAIDKTTHCPLKGNTTYFDVVVGDRRITQGAWCYVDTIDQASQLRGLVAFDTAHISVS